MGSVMAGRDIDSRPAVARSIQTLRTLRKVEPMASPEYNRRFSAMSLTALRKYAAEEYDLKGLSKADRATVQAAINRARQAKPINNDTRERSYREQGVIRSAPK